MVALVCFSLASALRCPGLSRIEAITLTIPPALQLLLTLFLVRSALRSKHHKNWLIVLEAFVYLVLVVTDFGIHETVRDSDNTFLNAFIVADKAVGSCHRVSLSKSKELRLTRFDLPQASFHSSRYFSSPCFSLCFPTTT